MTVVGNDSGEATPNATMKISRYFHADADLTLFIRQWHTSSAAEILGTMLAVALLAFMVEALAVYRLRVAYNALLANPSHEFECQLANDKQKSTTGDLMINNEEETAFASQSTDFVEDDESTGSFEFLHKPLYKLRTRDEVIQVCLRLLTTTFAYLGMLAFFTYNVWMAVAIISGYGIAFVVFYNVEKKYAVANTLLGR